MNKTIFRDWKENKGPLGVAVLKKKLKEGLPFIPIRADDRKNQEQEALTEIYVPEKWLVEWLSFTKLGESYVHKEKKSFWIRRKKTQGLYSSGRSTAPPTFHHAAMNIEDKFLIVDGIEIY
jgi:hypothetical protein